VCGDEGDRSLWSRLSLRSRLSNGFRAATTGSGRLEHTHRRTLLIDDVPNRSRHAFELPQPACTAMPRPALSRRTVQLQAVQASARIGRKIVHDSLRQDVRIHHDVDMIGAPVGCQEIPAAIRAALDYREEHGLASLRIESIRRLVHLALFCRDSARIGLDETVPGQMVRSIHRARCIAVHVTAVTSESYEVGHWRLDRSLWSRLSYTAARLQADRLQAARLHTCCAKLQK
jgi:hypothetical protein